MTAPADPELLLAAACCRWPPSPARDATVRACAAAVDWARFARVVVRQRIAGLVDAALRAADITPPEAIAVAIARAARRIAHHNMIATAETARVVRAISAAGYPVLAVKGVVLGSLAYGSIVLKHSKDIDLLILPDHIEAVIALLASAGFSLSFPAERLTPAQCRVLPRYGKDISMVRGGGQRVEIELHWRLLGNARILPGITAASPRQDVTLSRDITVPTLAAADLYAYLVSHGAGDGWSRMKWIADLNALLAAQDDAAIRAWHDGAVARGVGRASAQALILCHELFALALDADFVAALSATPRVRMLLAGAYRLMAVRDGTTEIGDWRAGRMMLLGMQPLLGHGLAYQWQIVRSVLYTPDDMYRSTMPPALYIWYPLVRVPLWVARAIARTAKRLAGRDKAATLAAKS